jgi:hypothetical protein
MPRARGTDSGGKTGGLPGPHAKWASGPFHGGGRVLEVLARRDVVTMSARSRVMLTVHLLIATHDSMQHGGHFIHSDR